MRSIFGSWYREDDDDRYGPVPPPDSGEPVPEPAWVPWVWARGTLVLTILLYVIAFPPIDVPEGAFVFAVPAAFWSLRRPRWLEYLVVTGGASFVSWLVLLGWIREVAVYTAWVYVGLGALAVFMAIFPTLWFAAVRWAIPRAAERDVLVRVLTLLGLAGLWVVIEWVRGWIFTGFPWLPLAASQWTRPAMLQGAAAGGAWLISFALIAFNLGLAAYMRRLHLWIRERKGRFCPEFYVGAIVLLGSSFGTLGEVGGQKREPLFRAGLIQPDIPQSNKWDPAEAQENLNILFQQTTLIRFLDPDVIFWPEAATPTALVGDPVMEAWITKLSTDLKCPIVAGSVIWDEPTDPDAEETVANSVVVIDPEIGIERPYYAKRHLVPFGEYVPFRRLLPFMTKLVPIGGDIRDGTDPVSLPVRTADRTTRVGPLVCYEDVFPGLARDSVKAGAQVLFVATNNAWFGRSGAAYQHAAHSVLRAVETRRPVIRVGNSGWSGWIDEYGNIRERMVNERKSIYHRGATVYAIDRDRRWVGKETLFVQWGDWFVWLSAALAALGGWTLYAAGRKRAWL